MVNANRRPVAPVRKLVAAILGTIAAFVMLFGLGMTSWPIVALGAAMLALAIGLTLVNVVRRGARTWVSGTAHVTSASEPPASSSYGRCELQIVVAAPGLPTSAVKVRDSRVPIDRWPVVGDTLPVKVDVDDMRRVRIQWGQVPTHTEAAMRPTAATYPDPLDDPSLADDLLAEPEAPPWVTRDRQWGRGPDETDTTADLSGQLDDFRGVETAGPHAGDPHAGDQREQPVVVRDAPGGGPIVLEGTLVEPPSPPGPLPRRARPSPSPRPRPGPGRPGPAGPGAAGSGAAPSGAAGSTATATVDADQSLDDLLNAGSDSRLGAATGRPGTISGTDDAPPPPPSADVEPDDDVSTGKRAAPTGSPVDLPLDDTRPATAPESPWAPPAQAGPAEAGERKPATGPGPTIWPMGDPGRDATSRPASMAAGHPGAPTPATADPALADPTAADPEIDLPLDEDTHPVDKLSVLAPHDAGAAPHGDGGRAYPGAASTSGQVGTRTTEQMDDLITAYPSARPGPGGAIHGVGVTVLVTALDRAVRFYRDVLGFFEIDGGHGSAVLASGDTRLVLRTVQDLSAMTGRLIYLNLEVGDVDAVYAELRDKGVTFVHGPRPVNRGDRLELWAASFHDPDGHNIAITQWRAAR